MFRASVACRRAAAHRPVCSLAGRGMNLPQALVRCAPTLHSLHQPALRHLSSGASPADNSEPAAEPKPRLLFDGAKSFMVIRIKQASLANLGFAVTSAPLLYYITALSGNSGKGIAMSTILTLFGAGTTGGLYWATGTYVLAMYSKGDDAVTIELPTLTGGRKEVVVNWADMSPPESYHPFVTFEAKGRKFYLDEVGTIHDESLTSKLEAAMNRNLKSE